MTPADDRKQAWERTPCRVIDRTDGRTVLDMQDLLGTTDHGQAFALEVRPRDDLIDLLQEAVLDAPINEVSTDRLPVLLDLRTGVLHRRLGMEVEGQERALGLGYPGQIGDVDCGMHERLGGIHTKRVPDPDARQSPNDVRSRFPLIC